MLRLGNTIFIIVVRVISNGLVSPEDPVEHNIDRYARVIIYSCITAFFNDRLSVFAVSFYDDEMCFSAIR